MLKAQQVRSGGIDCLNFQPVYLPRTVVVCFLTIPRNVLVDLVTELMSVIPPFCWALSTEESPVSQSQNQVVPVETPTRTGMGPLSESGISVFCTGCCRVHAWQSSRERRRTCFFIAQGVGESVCPAVAELQGLCLLLPPQQSLWLLP